MGGDKKSREEVEKKTKKSSSRKRSVSPASASEDEGGSRKRSRREEKKKEKRKDSKSRSHRSDKEKKDKRKVRDQKGEDKPKGDIQELSADDYFAKNNEFATWLKEKKKVFFSDLSAEAAREYFADFVKAWNKQKLDSRYYEGISSGPRTAHNWKIK
ncbi:Style cell-cycle inhibitor 1-B [Linum perenne]